MINGTAVKELTTAVSSRRGVFALRPEGKMDFANLFVRQRQ